jgi:hypothetical protein
MTDRTQKITFAEMRESGIRGLLVYCADYRCSHSIAISGDAWPDDIRLSDIEPRLSTKPAAMPDPACYVATALAMARPLMVRVRRRYVSCQRNRLRCENRSPGDRAELRRELSDSIRVRPS